MSYQVLIPYPSLVVSSAPSTARLSLVISVGLIDGEGADVLPGVDPVSLPSCIVRPFNRADCCAHSQKKQMRELSECQKPTRD